jgi:intergrase/recombinase
MARSAHKEVSYNQLKIQFKRHNVGDIHMLFCRKIFATYLRLEGVEQEIIDLLQSSIPRNVFVRHYFRPNFAKENEKITISLEKLYEKIRCLLLEIDTDCIVNKSGSIIDIHVA